MKNPEIAKTIIQQLGGFGRLKCMVAGNNYIDHGNGVSFRFKGSKDVNYVKVLLDADDTYSVEYGKIWGHSYKVKKEVSGVYCDQLIPMFEDTTKLYLSL